MTGTLYNSTPPITGVADGAFFFSLTGSSLTYSVSTHLLSVAGFELSAAGFSLHSGAVDLALPILGHDVTGFSGCSLTFAAFPPYSVQHPESGIMFFPFGIADPGSCRAFFQMSMIHGSVEISQSDLPLFDRPDFAVTVSSLGIVGQTYPDVTIIPEPTALTLLGLMTLGIGRRRRPTRANKITAANQLGPGSFDPISERFYGPSW